jgi:hypothetical protein
MDHSSVRSSLGVARRAVAPRGGAIIAAFPGKHKGNTGKMHFLLFENAFMAFMIHFSRKN